MQLIKLYQPFFDANNWAHVLTSGQDWMMILTLILMECLLSVDNAVVLAAQTQVLPTKDEQRKSLVYGLCGWKLSGKKQNEKTRYCLPAIAPVCRNSLGSFAGKAMLWLYSGPLPVWRSLWHGWKTFCLVKAALVLPCFLAVNGLPVR